MQEAVFDGRLPQLLYWDPFAETYHSGMIRGED